MTILGIILGFVIMAAGLVGCVVPVIPGPALGYLALIILAMSKGWATFSTAFYIIMALLCIFVSTVDGILPVLGAKRVGASKAGLWGSVIGLFVGLFIAPPWTIFLGGFVGAVAGELIVRKDVRLALKAGWGIFLGNVAAIGMKLAYCVLVLFFYIKALF